MKGNDQMLLSEAIRLGAMLGPQEFGTLRIGNATCALGAACLAAGFTLSEGTGAPDCIPLEAFKAWPILDHYVDPNLICEHKYPDTSVEGSIVHLNDVHRWTRERIADWVESIERAQGLIPAQPNSNEQTNSIPPSGRLHHTEAAPSFEETTRV